MSRIIIDQDNRATSHAASNTFESLIAEVADVPSVTYMASQRAKRARMLLTHGSIEARLAALWIDAFIAGAKFQHLKERR